jgi:hypothetical protein
MSYYLEQYITQLNRKIILQKLNAYFKEVYNIVPDSYVDIDYKIASKNVQRLALGIILSIILGFVLITSSVTIICINFYNISMIKGLIGVGLINLICINMFLQLIDVDALLFVIQFSVILFGIMTEQRIQHTIKNKFDKNGLLRLNTYESEKIYYELYYKLYDFVKQLTSDYKNILTNTIYRGVLNTEYMLYVMRNITDTPIQNMAFGTMVMSHIGNFIRNIINDVDKLKRVDQVKFCKKCLTKDRTELYEYQETQYIQHVDCVKNQLIHGFCGTYFHINCSKKTRFDYVYSDQIKELFNLTVGDCICKSCINRRKCLACHTIKNLTTVKISKAYKIYLCDKCEIKYVICKNNENINKSDLTYLKYISLCKKVNKWITQNMNNKFKTNKQMYTISDCRKCNNQIDNNYAKTMDMFKKAHFVCTGCINPFKKIET